MNRRGFLSAILAAAVAPAVVKAESLMRVVVPKSEPINTLVGMDFGTGGFTIETWVKPGSDWQHIAQVRKDGILFSYVNGVLIPNKDFNTHGLRIDRQDKGYVVGLDNPDQKLFVSELRLTSIARPEENVQKAAGNTPEPWNTVCLRNLGYG